MTEASVPGSGVGHTSCWTTSCDCTCWNPRCTMLRAEAPLGTAVEATRSQPLLDGEAQSVRQQGCLHTAAPELGHRRAGPHPPDTIDQLHGAAACGSAIDERQHREGVGRDRRGERVVVVHRSRRAVGDGEPCRVHVEPRVEVRVVDRNHGDVVDGRHRGGRIDGEHGPEEHRCEAACRQRGHGRRRGPRRQLDGGGRPAVCVERLERVEVVAGQLVQRHPDARFTYRPGPAAMSTPRPIGRCVAGSSGTRARIAVGDVRRAHGGGALETIDERECRPASCEDYGRTRGLRTLGRCVEVGSHLVVELEVADDAPGGLVAHRSCRRRPA